LGEILTPILLPEADYFVLHPGVSVSTAQLFAHPELTRNQATLTVADFLANPDSNAFGNVFESLVCHQQPAIREALEWLANQAGNSRLTGTGACVFARLDKTADGKKIAARLPTGWFGFVAHSCQVSPLQQALTTM
jgi:4-diphosphocytidyl-2-C-methyl-D-erythritol kinase